MVLVALAGAAGVRPAPVLADSGPLTVETPLHDSPDPAAPVIALLAEGTVVSIDGPPVDGFYPVIVGDLSGWMRGETVQLEKDTPESVPAEDLEADPLVNNTDETVRVEAPGDLEPATDPDMSTIDSATDAAADSSAASEESPPLAEPAPAETVPTVGAVPAEELPRENASAPMDEPTMDDAAAAPPAPDLASTGDATSVLTAPDSAAAAPDSAAHAAEVAAAPTMDPNVTPIPVAEISPVGPASVMADAPILLGPGPDYGVIATAPAGSTVEKTGHVIDGYVTVQFAGVTGWVALGTLGVPSTLGLETPPSQTPPGETAALVETPLADVPPTEPPPTELAPTDTPPAETPPAETVSVAATPTDAAPIEAAPIAAT
jgi:hypothetical protein